jgi:hypothetical protein
MAFDGYVKVRTSDGTQVLDVVEAHLDAAEREGHHWGGVLRVSAGGGLAGKHLPVLIDAPGSFTAPALLGPSERDGQFVTISVLGSGPAPF